MKAAVYFGSRKIYADMVSAYKSLLVNSDVNKIYLLIEDDEFPYEVHRDVEVINISKLIEKWFVPNGANWGSGWTYIGLIRGALAKVFPELDKILSIDCDTLVQSDVSDLWDIPIDDYYVAGVMEPALSRYSNGLYINAGVTMWNLKKLREDGKDDEMIEDLNRNKRMFVSQDTLNAVCRGHILKINASYNACAYTEQASETKIVHFAGGIPGNWRDLETVKYYRNLPIEEIRPEKKNRMKTLDIIVPHYKEPWDFCKYLFDTIAIQRGILFDNVRVIMVNDGKQTDSNLTAKDLSDIERNYPFQTDVYFKPHEGVSAARNYGLQQSDADYVMFCDADDGFLNGYSLHLVFAAMQEGFDYLIPSFVEETFDEGGNPIIINHDQDLTFMHGKAYRRQFLIDNDLRFDEAMTIHEDGYFNMLVYTVAQHKGKIKTIGTPIYLWRWNNDSVVRNDRKDFVLRTYYNVMQTRIGLCCELKRREYEEDFRTAVCMTVMNSYYDFQKPRYNVPENAKYVKSAEKEFRKFWMKFNRTFYDLTNAKIAEVAQVARGNAVKNGMLMERQSLNEFLKHIEHEVKP